MSSNRKGRGEEEVNTFEYLDSLWNLFTGDEELLTLMNLNGEDDYSYAIHLQEMPAEKFSPDYLPMLEVYFADSEPTYNDFAKRGILHIDIMVNRSDPSLAGKIRKRIVELMFQTYNEVSRGEGQFESGIRDIYKYRVVYTPLVNTKG